MILLSLSILFTENATLKIFMCSFDLASLIDLTTCYKSLNPTCIDLILTNKKNHFMKSTAFETGLSDDHKLITTIKKLQIKVILKQCSTELARDLTKRNLKLS